jgi:hypothetical protein
MKYLVPLFFLFDGLMSLELDTFATFSVKVMVMCGLSIGILGVVESFALANTYFITLPLKCHQVSKLL